MVKKVVNPARISVKNFEPFRSFSCRNQSTGSPLEEKAWAYMARSLQAEDSTKGGLSHPRIDGVDEQFDGRHDDKE